MTLNKFIYGIKLMWTYLKARFILLFHYDRSYFIDGKWFHFNAEGYLTLGWYLSEDGKWYYCAPDKTLGTPIGAMYTGWLKDGADGYWYYLDPNTGEMLTGWRDQGTVVLSQPGNSW